EMGNKIRKKKDELTKKLGRSPTVNEIANDLNVPVEEIVHAQEAVKQPQSIHQTVFENDGDPITLLDQIPNKDTGCFNKLTLRSEMGNKIRKKKDELTKKLGRSPTVNEIANDLNVPVEEIVHAQEAVKQPQSIHQTVFENDGDPITLLDQIPNKDTGWFNKLTLQEAMQTLEERERLILFLRYYKDKTQTEVAERLGISQV